MSFNIDIVMVDMLSAIKGTVENNWDIVKFNTSHLLQRDKERLQMLAVLRITGCLTDEKYQARLEDQKQVIESELSEFIAINETTAKLSAYAAIDVLEKAVGGADSLSCVLEAV